MKRREYPGEMWHGANHLPWAADPIAQHMVHEHGELTLQEIGSMLGVTREAVRQLIAASVQKLLEGDAIDHDLRRQFEAWQERENRADLWEAAE